MHSTTPGEQVIAPGEVSIAPAWEDWYAEAESWTMVDDDTASRAYKLWNFAADLNDGSIDDVGRGTVVQKLWNAVDHRIRSLHEIYCLNVVKSLLGLPRTSASLDTLHHLGVVRPLILKNLRVVRNRVEHQDRGAPDANECSNLVDSVWYFLRSTDYLVVQKLNTYTLRSGMAVQGSTEQEEFASISVSADWGMRMSGWFREQDIIANAGDSEFGITMKLDRQPERSGMGDVFLSGSVAPASTGLQRLIRDYFAVELPSGARINKKR
ncbi:hypothetical protein MN032_16490 [Agromyces atrinae]|uniref:hypothetical protein n=1 Tax=Agromyces atrinae TaxID=592376 RepID=UPI001F59DEE4|nr:hypothetical protein [Agromyces atrinae]MCI2959287.1 hypothetical protein [Agromyces atrinae]